MLAKSGASCRTWERCGNSQDSRSPTSCFTFSTSASYSSLWRLRQPGVVLIEGSGGWRAGQGRRCHQVRTPSVTLGPSHPSWRAHWPTSIGTHCGGTSRIGTHRAPPHQSQHIDEAAALPSPGVMLSTRFDQYYGRLRRPPGTPPTSRDHRL